MFRRLMTMVLALALAAVMIGTAAAEGAEDPVLVTVNGKEIRESDAETQFWVGYLINNAGADPETDMPMIQQYAMNYNIRYTIMEQKLAESGKTLTQEELDVFTAEAKAEWDEIVDSMTAELYGIGEDASEEDKTAGRADTLAYIEANYGYTEESYVAESATIGRLIWAEEQVRAIASEGLTVTDEEAEEYFLTIIEEDKAMLYYGTSADDMTEEEILESMVGTYEIYGNLYGYEFMYVPEGYRGITHILLDVDPDLLTRWQDLKARLEEQEEGDEAADEDADGEAQTTAEPEEPVTPEMVEEARQAILDSVQDKVEEIRAKLADGVSFDELIQEYGTDPGMQDDTIRAEGYPVHKYSLIYDTDFRNCAMDLAAPGDISDPIVSQMGVHILCYLRDIEAGSVPYTDEVKNNLKETLLSEKVQTAMSELTDQWMTESEIVWTEAGQAWQLDEEPEYADDEADAETEAAPAE